MADDDVIRPTPLLAMWNDWADASMPYRQPFMAMLAGVTAFSSCMGKSYTGPTGAISPLMTLILAPPGGGKDTPQNMARYFMEQIGLPSLLGAGHWGSAQGLERELGEKHELFAICDEFADIVKANCHPNCPSYKKEIFTILKKVFNGEPYTGSAKKDGEATVNIVDPRIALLAAAPVDTFWNAINEEIIGDGLMSRINIFNGAIRGLVVKGRTSANYKESFPVAIKDFAVEALKKAGRKVDQDPSGKILAMPNSRIPYADATAKAMASELQYKYRIEYEELHHAGARVEGALRGRTFERIIRLAAVYAWTERTSDISVSVAAIKWASALVDYADSTTLRALGGSLNTEDRVAKLFTRIKSAIIGAGSTGASRAYLVDRLRLGRSEIENVIQEMTRSKLVGVSATKRGTTIYVWLGDSGEVSKPEDRTEIT